jgi:hypothetical protein
MRSHDGYLANQMSRVLFMFTNFTYKTSRFILCGNLGMDLFELSMVWHFAKISQYKCSRFVRNGYDIQREYIFAGKTFPDAAG